MSLYVKSGSSRKTISVILFTKYKLVQSQLKLLLECKSEIKVQDFVSSTGELLKKISEKKPDVVLFCLMDDEIENIEVLPHIFEISPNSKALILSTKNGKVDQTKVLKLGATGIVYAHQKIEVLIRAIRQVCEGEVCLNQQLMAQLLGNGANGSNKLNGANGDSREQKLFRNDALTTREMEVIGVIAQGLTNKEISKQLYISEATVRHHLSSIYGKVQVEDRLNLVIYAYQNKIVNHCKYAE